MTREPLFLDPAALTAPNAPVALQDGDGPTGVNMDDIQPDAGATEGAANGTTSETAQPAGGDQQETAPSPGLGGSFWIWMLAMVAVFWLLILGPERKRKKEHEALVGGLGKNDHVVTLGGIKGVVVRVDKNKDEVVVRVDDKNDVKMTFNRSAIQQVESSKSKKDGKDADSEEKN